MLLLSKSDPHSANNGLRSFDPYPPPGQRIAAEINGSWFSRLHFTEATAVPCSTVAPETGIRQSRNAKSSCACLIAERVPIVQIVRAWRGPEDEKFLELAVNGAAPVIITGDADLLALHPFRDIDILTPASYLTR